MQIEAQFAGFGGQGILLAGKLLAEAGMSEGKQVAWIPSYGPEMRGGTAYCTVVISDESISSPIINNPLHLIAMNRPSLEKFGPRVRKNGLIIINSSLILITSQREDVTELLIPCNQIANEIGNIKGPNMVVLGAYVAASGVVSLETTEAIMRHEFKDKPQFVELNAKALLKGAEAVYTQMEKVK
jgi:2-oxoglutarate ferredoxin oxidoreductase subunit gamma